MAGPTPAPTPAVPELPQLDPWWDLPLEELPAAGEPDTVASGESLPDGYAISAAASRLVGFPLASILVGQETFDFA